MLTVSVKVAVLLISELVPMTIIVYVPGGVAPVVVIVMVEGQVGVQLVGENVAVTPDGSPTADNDTVGVVPGVRSTTLISLVTLLPR